ncbi:MAG: hypothetical protein ACRCUP_04150 [Mycoplasmatales bacterium]
MVMHVKVKRNLIFLTLNMALIAMFYLGEFDNNVFYIVLVYAASNLLIWRFSKKVTEFQ